ncbi:hypothetical protein PSENEW3_00004608 [Picochlorum sp. SENEW3]|nr:hypothetical protein PSENEW3_00004608 [Picochlorum sp. SENEW3]
MNENQTNNTKENRPRKPHGRPEGSKRKRVKPSIGPYEEPTPRVDPILQTAYNLLNQLKGLMKNMFGRGDSSGYIDEQVFTTSLAIIGWLNQQVTLRYALEVQNYRGDAMASQLLSMQEQVVRETMARKETVLHVAAGEKRREVAQTTLQEHEEGKKGTKVLQPPALSDEEIAMMLHREMNVQPFLRPTSQEKKDKTADPVTSGLNEQLAMLVEKITGFKCDQNL